MKMNTYMVAFKPNADTDAAEEIITAHRMEGWQQDYAFFGHPSAEGVLTELIPRDLVLRVFMLKLGGDEKLLPELVVEIEERRLAQTIEETGLSTPDEPEDDEDEVVSGAALRRGMGIDEESAGGMRD